MPLCYSRIANSASAALTRNTSQFLKRLRERPPRRARRDVLAPYLKAQHLAIGSINSPMQCMMKEICAQCLQPHRDPATGKTSWVFSCFNQDQPLDLVDFGTLNERLKQNSLAEKLTAQWIRHCMPALKKDRSFV